MDYNSLHSEVIDFVSTYHEFLTSGVPGDSSLQDSFLSSSTALISNVDAVGTFDYAMSTFFHGVNELLDAINTRAIYSKSILIHIN